MNTDFERDTLREELVPPMPPAFSEAVDTALFTAIRRENEKKKETETEMQVEREKEKRRTSRRQSVKKLAAAAAVVVLLMATAFTAGLGIFHKQDSTPAASTETGTNAQLVQSANNWDGKLTALPMYAETAPKAQRYDLSGGYAHTEELLDLVQEKLSWMQETDYDELWLLSVLDLSQWTYGTVTYTGTGTFDRESCPWMQKENRLFALVQYDFDEDEGPMLVECTLNDKGVPTYCEVKTMSSDPQRDGLYYRSVEDCSEPAVYLGYGIDANRGQMTCGLYSIDFTAVTSLNVTEAQKVLENSAHKDHIRQWYLYAAPAEPQDVKLFNESGKEKTTAMGPVAKQTVSSNGVVGLRSTYDGKTEYNTGILLEKGMEEKRLKKYFTSNIEFGYDWEYDYPTSFRLSVDTSESHTLCLETNRADVKVKKIYAYALSNDGRMEMEKAPETVEELFSLEGSDWNEYLVFLLTEADGQEYLLHFTIFFYDGSKNPDIEENNTFTPIAKRYDLTGGCAYSDRLLDGVEATLQNKGIEYEELWLEAVHDFGEYPYDLLRKRYGDQLWLRNVERESCLALVQYDFSEGAGPMLVSFYYGNPDEVETVGIILENIDPNVDSCYGYAASETDPPYVIEDRFYCMGTGASSGEIYDASFFMRFSSQLPLDQVQELVKDSPNKSAAREWYLLPITAIGKTVLYDANGLERELRHGNTVYNNNYARWRIGDYRDENA